MWDDLTEKQRGELMEAVSECCCDMYWCQRVWEAWSYGTMSQGDFVPADNCEDFLADVAESVLDRASKMGAVDNSTQHLQAKIRALYEMADAIPTDCRRAQFTAILDELRELSAAQ